MDPWPYETNAQHSGTRRCDGSAGQPDAACSALQFVDSLAPCSGAATRWGRASRLHSPPATSLKRHPHNLQWALGSLAGPCKDQHLGVSSDLAASWKMRPLSCWRVFKPQNFSSCSKRPIATASTAPYKRDLNIARDVGRARHSALEAFHQRGTVPRVKRLGPLAFNLASFETLLLG